jgi:hypothetical protein
VPRSTETNAPARRFRSLIVTAGRTRSMRATTRLVACGRRSSFYSALRSLRLDGALPYLAPCTVTRVMPLL